MFAFAWYTRLIASTAYGLRSVLNISGSQDVRLHHALMRVAVPKRGRFLDVIKQRESWGPERIVAYQEERLRRTIRYSWDYVPFYRRHWRTHLDDPREIRTIADLQGLPPLTRSQVREYIGELITTEPGVRYSESRTGGSTASPIVYHTTRDDDEWAWAQLYTGWTWAGRRMGDPFLVIGGESVGAGLGDKRTWRDWIINRWVSSGSNITLERTRHVCDQTDRCAA